MFARLSDHALATPAAAAPPFGTSAALAASDAAYALAAARHQPDPQLPPPPRPSLLELVRTVTRAADVDAVVAALVAATRALLLGAGKVDSVRALDVEDRFKSSA